MCDQHNDNHLAPDKPKIKKEMLSDYQWKIDNRNDIPMGKVKKPVADFLIKKSMCFITKTCNFI